MLDTSRMSKAYYAYLLRSLKDGKFYAGHTADLRKRLARHDRGLVRSTKGRRPFKLVYWEAFKTRGEAMGRERELKSLRRAGKLKLIRAWRARKIRQVFNSRGRASSGLDG